MPAAFSAFGPEQVAQGVSPPTLGVARLAGGGNVVGWVADGGQQVRVQRTDATGQPVGTSIAVNTPNGQGVPKFSVAAAADGGFIVAWVISDAAPATQFSAVQAVQARRYAADGTLLNDVRVNDGYYSGFTGTPVVRATADGGFVVGWTGEVMLTAPSWGFLQRLAADGSRAGPLVSLGGGAPELTHLTPVPLADGTVLVAWLQQDFVATGGSTYSVYTQRFGADSAPLADAFRLDATSGTAPFPLDAAALSNGNVALAWIVKGSAQSQVRSTLLTTAGHPAAAITAYDWTNPAWELPSVSVIRLADGFGVAWEALQGYNRGMLADIWLQRHAGSGAATDMPTQVVARSTASYSSVGNPSHVAAPGFSVDGGADGHFVASYQAIGEQATGYLLGQ